MNWLVALGLLLMVVGLTMPLFAGVLADALMRPLQRRVERARVRALTRDSTIPDVPDEWPAGDVDAPSIIISDEVVEAAPSGQRSLPTRLWRLGYRSRRPL